MTFRFEELEIWHEANDLAEAIYKVTRKFPKSELFGLGDQLRRAVNSIPTNIAEGSGSNSKKDFAHFLNVSIRSVFEVVSLLYRCEQEKFITKKRRLLLYSKAEMLVKRIHRFRSVLLR